MKKTWMSGIALAAILAFAGAANAQIKMGVAGPITGPNAAFGAQLTMGTQYRWLFHAEGMFWRERPTD